MYPAQVVLLALVLGSGFGTTLALPVDQKVPDINLTLVRGLSDFLLGTGSTILENGSHFLGQLNSALGGQTTF